MQIHSFSLDMASSHVLQRQQTTQTSFTPSSQAKNPTQTLQEQIETMVRTVKTTLAQSIQPPPLAVQDKTASSALFSNDDVPPLLSLVQQILEKVLGIRFKLSEGKLVPDQDNAEVAVPSQTTPPPTPDHSGVLTTTQEVREQEQTHFSATGTITTKEGQVFSFQLTSQLQRAFYASTRVSQAVGPSGSVDPLMIILPEGSGRLSGASVAFDLKSNGNTVSLPFVSGGGWLAWDKEHDGKIRDGSQLFGPQSGNGFNDLAKQDSNHDGVIDSGDTIYADLMIWHGVDSQGNAQLQSLSSLRIGAILLSNVETPFSLRDSQNQAQGEVRRSGIYVTEDGQAGRISQVDIVA